jgi:hypothetical protein
MMYMLIVFMDPGVVAGGRHRVQALALLASLGQQSDMVSAMDALSIAGGKSKQVRSTN